MTALGLEAPSCPTCGSSMVWEECDVCGGDGEIEVYDSDPLWYDPDDAERCEQCAGKGGWWFCRAAGRHKEKQNEE